MQRTTELFHDMYKLRSIANARETIQYVNKHWVRFKNQVCLKEKEAYDNK